MITPGTCYQSFQDGGVGKATISDYSWLYGESEASLGSMVPF